MTSLNIEVISTASDQEEFLPSGNIPPVRITGRFKS